MLLLLLLGLLRLLLKLFCHQFKSCRIVFIFCVSIFISGVFSSLTFSPKYKLCARSFNSIIAPSSKDCYFDHKMASTSFPTSSSNNVDNQATSQSMTLSAADLYNTSAFLGDLLGLAPASNSAKGRTSGLVKTYQVFF